MGWWKHYIYIYIMFFLPDLKLSTIRRCVFIWKKKGKVSQRSHRCKKINWEKNGPLSASGTFVLSASGSQTLPGHCHVVPGAASACSTSLFFGWAQTVETFGRPKPAKSRGPCGTLPYFCWQVDFCTIYLYIKNTQLIWMLRMATSYSIQTQLDGIKNLPILRSVPSFVTADQGILDPVRTPKTLRNSQRIQGKNGSTSWILSTYTWVLSLDAWNWGVLKASHQVIVIAESWWRLIRLIRRHLCTCCSSLEEKGPTCTLTLFPNNTLSCILYPHRMKAASLLWTNVWKIKGKLKLICIHIMSVQIYNNLYCNHNPM